VPADLIIYAFIAVGLVFWLKNTLGTHEEGDEPVNVRPPLPTIEEGQAATLPIAAAQEERSPESQIEEALKNKEGALAIEGAQSRAGLINIIESDSSFDLKFFFGAVQDVFVMVVEAFADGDREALDGVLGDRVYGAFDEAITAREAAGQRAEAEVQSISEVHIIEARVDGKKAFVTVRFVADQIHAVYDENDNVIEGHPSRMSHMKDIWVFSRDLKSKDPRWFVVETRGDFEGDNDIIPDTH
jgi:predicted lipid-binding transport protein (Tim44 family)